MYDRKVADARYRERHREAYNARIRKWKLDNPEKTKEQRKSYKDRHKEEINVKQAEYRRLHKTKLKEYNAQYYEKNSEDYRIRLNDWRKSNPERAKAQIHIRRTRKTQAGGEFTAEEWLVLCEKYGNKCLCCGENKKLVPDHVIPVAKGGTSNIENIQPLCQSCNSRKSVRIIDYRIPQRERG
jgi:5-methylcytosine-specific restriction endonuclease McrA